MDIFCRVGGGSLRDDQVRDIFRYVFDGFGFPQVAELVGCSAPTVRNWFNRFLEEAKRSDIVLVARTYGVEGQVKGLMNLSQELKSSELEVSECVVGSRAVKMLRDLGVARAVVAQGLKPGEFARALAMQKMQ